MSSSWTNKYAIIHDLSIVQGCVPGEIDGSTVGVGEKPPAPDLVEESEEEFYKKFTSGDDESVLMPDFEPIRMFLDMVHENSSPEDEIESQRKGKVIITKLNPLCPEFVPKSICDYDNNNKREITNNTMEAINITEIINDDKTNYEFSIKVNSSANTSSDDINNAKYYKTKDFTKTQKPLSEKSVKSSTEVISKFNNDKDNKPRKKRNVAFESILEMVEKENTSATNGFIDNTPTPVKKVQKPIKKVCPLLLDPYSMFKPKEKCRKETAAPSLTDKVEKPKISPIKKYVPTKQAEEYYKKFMERSQKKQHNMEDIWTRAERIMKELNLKWKIDAELKALEESLAASKIDSTVVPPQHKTAQAHVNATTRTENFTDDKRK